MSIPKAHEMLMNSPGYRKNILAPEYSNIGIGTVTRGGQIYVTQNFISFRSSVLKRGSEREYSFHHRSTRRLVERIRPIPSHHSPGGLAPGM